MTRGSSTACSLRWIDGGKPDLRVVVLKGNGKHFQAGADLKWINGVQPNRRGRKSSVAATFEAVQRLNTLPIPTVALVQGGCFGGGTEVISACDVVSPPTMRCSRLPRCAGA